MKLAPGTVFANDFTVVRELSTGGMGTLYVALQKSTGKQRALKLMLPQMVLDPDLRRRFEQEAKIGSLIESDHVVEVVAAGVDEETPWLAMELLRGEELTPKAVMGAPGPLTALQVIMRQVCHAVGAAHKAGIVHRDLKPANVFLAESKRAGETRTVKVLDFGIAKIAAEAATQHTMAMGSPTWMAPEQSETGTITAAADVWSLALIAYNLLTDRLFWKASQDPKGTVHMVMKEVLFDPIPLASERAAEQGAGPLPPWFDAWFSRCIVRQASLRYRDANVAFAAFEAAIGGGHISLLPPTLSPYTTPLAPPTRPSGHQRISGPPAPYGPGTTVMAPLPSPPAPKPRWAAPLLGLACACAVIYFAWPYRYGRPYVAPAKPFADVPSATADLPLDDEDFEPAPPLAGDASARPTTKKKPSKPSGSSALSAALDQYADVKPPPLPKSDFDRAGAVLKLHAQDLQKCATPDGPKGTSRVLVAYGNDGAPSRVVFDRRGPFAGSPIEPCLGLQLRQARVEPFTGAEQLVSIRIEIR